MVFPKWKTEYLFQVRFWHRLGGSFNPGCRRPQLKISYFLILFIDLSVQNVFESLELVLEYLIVRHLSVVRVPVGLELVLKLELVLGNLVLLLYLLKLLALDISTSYLDCVIGPLLHVLVDGFILLLYLLAAFLLLDHLPI